MKKVIGEFNIAYPNDRIVDYYSKPIFDDSGGFAIIERDNSYSYLGGGGGIDLYKFQDGQWIIVGTVIQWRY